MSNYDDYDPEADAHYEAELRLQLAELQDRKRAAGRPSPDVEAEFARRMASAQNPAEVQAIYDEVATYRNPKQQMTEADVKARYDQYLVELSTIDPSTDQYHASKAAEAAHLRFKEDVGRA
jgi:hypothetical protein